MNERILELAARAAWGPTGDPYQRQAFNVPLFAQLVAEDCAQLCDRFQARDVGMQPAECAGAIRQMFDVVREAPHYTNTGNPIDFPESTPNSRKHIGWIEREEGYYKLYEPSAGSIVTQAFILCKHCGGSIYHCMGPKPDAVCLTCYDKDPDTR